MRLGTTLISACALSRLARLVPSVRLTATDRDGTPLIVMEWSEPVSVAHVRRIIGDGFELEPAETESRQREWIWPA